MGSLWRAVGATDVCRYLGLAVFKENREMIKLTRREVEVADMVAKGLSNCEIARGLTLSVRTVDTHLNNIYRKLHIRNRTQLAMRIAAKDLFV